MNAAEVPETTVASIHRAFLAGTLSARELTETYLRRISELDGPINSIVTTNPHAVAEAVSLDERLAATGELVGVLHGIPIVVKDQIETAGIATAFGSISLKDHVPAHDAPVVAKLKQAGAIVLAKSTLPDFATSWHGHSSCSGVTSNPYDLAHDPGGSSSGSAAAVAANLAVLGIGEDTGGSIRVPASFCCLVGVRPTPGLISRTGISPLVREQDTPGPLARTVGDAALALDAMIGWEPTDPFTAAAAIRHRRGPYTDELYPGGLRGARIGVLRECLGFSTPAETETSTVIESALGSLRGAGAVLVDPVAIPDLVADLQRTFFYFAQSRRDLNVFLASRDLPYADVSEIVAAGEYWPSLVLLRLIAAGPSDPYTVDGYAQNRELRSELQRKIVGVYATHELDAIAFPDVRMPPPARADIESGMWEEGPEGVLKSEFRQFPVNAVIASQALLPAISVPAGFTNGGLPVGLELMGLPYREAELIHLAYDFELATEHRRPPPEPAPAWPAAEQ